MIISNMELAQYYELYQQELSCSKLYIPVIANFFIQKNIKKLQEVYEEINAQKTKICEHYGELKEQSYVIPLENADLAANELNQLFSIEQDLDIKMIKLEDLGDIQLTPAQMQALMFMIED